MNWQELAPLSIADVVAWAANEPWARAMADCQQDAEWHAEGDVWTHVGLVCDQLPQLAGWADLDCHSQRVLLWTALLHDVAKPMTTQIDPATGRTTSPKHAVKGEHVARAILRKLGCDFSTREEIAAMVRYHGRPVFLWNKRNPEHEVIRLSFLVNNQLLYLFAVADTCGRVNSQTDRKLEDLALWPSVAQDLECLDRPYPFATDHARFKYFRQRTPDRFFVPHEEFRCRVTLMCGLPGAGKDTWLTRNRADISVVSLDAIRREIGAPPTKKQGKVAQIATERCRELLRSGTSFAFNATNTVSATRSRWLDLFAEYNAEIEIAYIEPPLEAVLKHNRSRDAKVPEHVIHDLADRIEPPTPLECHRIECVVD